MRLPRFRIRTLMIAVAVVALVMVVMPPWWRYWFRSPWTEVTLAPGAGLDGKDRSELRIVFDTRKPSDRQALTRVIRLYRSSGAEYSVRKFATSPNRRDRD